MAYLVRPNDPTSAKASAGCCFNVFQQKRDVSEPDLRTDLGERSFKQEEIKDVVGWKDK